MKNYTYILAINNYFKIVSRYNDIYIYIYIYILSNLILLALVNALEKKTISTVNLNYCKPSIVIVENYKVHLDFISE